jgi:hypothetical protein
MQEKDIRLLKIISLNVQAFKNDLYNYKDYIDQLEAAIRELEIDTEDINYLFDCWSNLEIIYSVMAYEQRRVFHQEELEIISQSLNKIEERVLSIMPAIDNTL